MTEPKTKKLSRRDAIKLLGAAVGASVLANLPSKWSTPELASGVLPAHAQTSGQLFALVCQQGVITNDITMPFPSPYTVGISPVQSGISMHWDATFGSGLVAIGTDSVDVLTNGAGIATIDLAAIPMGWVFSGTGNVNVRWTFTNPAQSTGTPAFCHQNNGWNAIV